MLNLILGQMILTYCGLIWNFFVSIEDYEHQGQHNYRSTYSLNNSDLKSNLTNATYT